MSNQKETILFVHGAWHGKWCWDKYFREEFTNRGYTVVTFDLPGHITSGKIKGINKFSIKDYVNALSVEVSKLDKAPIIVAHSMGGLILQKYLEKGECKKAIFLASVPPYGVINTTLKFARKSYFYPSLFGLNLYGLVNSDEKCKEAFFSDSLPQEDIAEHSAKMCSESFRAFLDMLLPWVKVTEKSKIPILVIGAENDTIFSIKDNEKTAKQYDAELVIIEDIAHDMMLDTNHEKVSTKILEWLQTNLVNTYDS